MDTTAQRILPAVMAFFMSMCVSFIVTAKNLGFIPDFVLTWLSAWSLAFPVAATAAYLFLPIARRLAGGAARMLHRVGRRGLG